MKFIAIITMKLLLCIFILLMCFTCSNGIAMKEISTLHNYIHSFMCLLFEYYDLLKGMNIYIPVAYF